MRPLAFTFPYFLIWGVAFLWAMFRESRIIRRAREGVKAGAPADRGSLLAVMLTQALGFGAAFTLAWAPWGRFADQRASFWIGLAVYIGGAVLRRMCFRALGQWFTGEVRVLPEQQIVTAGPYRWVRHPSYTAGILLVAGMSLILGTWLGTIIATSLATIGYLYRVRVEEAALVSTLGAPYVDYSARTRRFIPFVI